MTRFRNKPAPQWLTRLRLRKWQVKLAEHANAHRQWLGEILDSASPRFVSMGDVVVETK